MKIQPVTIKVTPLSDEAAISLLISGLSACMKGVKKKDGAQFTHFVRERLKQNSDRAAFNNMLNGICQAAAKGNSDVTFKRITAGTGASKVETKGNNNRAGAKPHKVDEAIQCVLQKLENELPLMKEEHVPQVIEFMTQLLHMEEFLSNSQIQRGMAYSQLDTDYDGTQGEGIFSAFQGIISDKQARLALLLNGLHAKDFIDEPTEGNPNIVVGAKPLVRNSDVNADVKAAVRKSLKDQGHHL